jgi:ureidoacrylate peracid hydrolase
MHRVDIPQWAVDRVLRKRGTLHVHERLEPAQTALIVIDMQNAFLVEEGAISYVPGGDTIVPNVNRLARAVRGGGGKVFWIQNTAAASDPVSWSNWFAAMPSAFEDRYMATMAPGAPGHRLHPGLEVEPADEVVFKSRFSAFMAGSSDLADRLRSAGIDTVLIAGVVTSNCCECTARDAVMLHFKTIMVSDANAAKTDTEHNGTLTTFYVSFGDVMDTDFVVERLAVARA